MVTIFVWQIGEVIDYTDQMEPQCPSTVCPMNPCESEIPAPAQTFAIVPFRWLAVFLWLQPSRRHKGLCLLSHTDATQTGWPQKNTSILASAHLALNFSASRFHLAGLGGTFQEPDRHIYASRTLLSVIYGDTELRQVKEVFASTPAKRRLMVCRSRLDVALLPRGCKMCLVKPSILFSHPFSRYICLSGFSIPPFSIISIHLSLFLSASLSFSLTPCTNL